MNVRGDSDVSQIEMRTAEPLVPEPSALKVEMALEKLNRHKSRGIRQILTAGSGGGGGGQFAESHKHITSVNFMYD